MKKKMRLSDNSQPLALIRSWLRYHGIRFSEGLAAPTDLVVGDPPTCVHVTIGSRDKGVRLQEPPGVNVNGFVIVYGDTQQTSREFQHMLRGVGIHEPLEPFDRGVPLQGISVATQDHPEGERLPIVGRVRRWRDGEELIVFRHDKFRRAPNPTQEQIGMYENVVGMATKVFFKHNRNAMQLLGFEYGDILDYAWVWATTYIAYYERPPTGHSVENQRLMYSWLQQQFVELWKKTLRPKSQERHLQELGRIPKTVPGVKNKEPVLNGGNLVDSGFSLADSLVEWTQFSATMNRGVRRGAGGGRSSIFNCYETEDTIITYLDLGKKGRLRRGKRKVKVDSSTGAERELERQLNKAHFLERLNSLPHDELLRSLTAASQAKMALETDARNAAARYLRDHKKSCRECREAATG